MNSPGWWYTCQIKGFCEDKRAGYMSLDGDADGIPDFYERRYGLDANQVDSDGDGVFDLAEIGEDPENALDTDSDGVINALDEDDDNDGDLSSLELSDPDGNGDPSDAVDTNGNGVPDYLDASTVWADRDDDADGVLNGEERSLGLNPESVDSDDDGISDAVELAQQPQDFDGDGLINARDADDDGDGVPSKEEGNSDLNGDGVADYLDGRRPEDSLIASTENKINVVVDPTYVVQDRESNQPVHSAKLYFPFGSTNPDISDQAEEYFAQILAFVEGNEAARIQLTGHTDSIGEEHDNETLGLQRAKVIMKILVEKGISEKRIDVSSQGETAPLRSNDTPQGRQENRRVELVPQQ